MRDVGLARYEPALLPPCPTIMVLCYSNCQRSIHSHQQFKSFNIDQTQMSLTASFTKIYEIRGKLSEQQANREDIDSDLGCITFSSQWCNSITHKTHFMCVGGCMKVSPPIPTPHPKIHTQSKMCIHICKILGTPLALLG